MNIKLTHTKVDNTPVHENKDGRLQVKKTIFNKALKTFIEEHYGIGIHFGNMNNNLKELLKKLNLDDVIEATVKLPYIDINKLTVVNDAQNEFVDFDPYEYFFCTFYAKEDVTPKQFAEAIKKFDENFIVTYNKDVANEVTKLDQNMRSTIKRRELNEIIFFIIIAVIAAIGIYYFYSVT